MRFFLAFLATAIASTSVGYAGDHLGDFMTAAQFRAAGLHKLSAAEMRSLERWFAATCGGQASNFVSDGPPKGPEFEELFGASIVAADGTFLGKISRSTLDNESISNSMSTYGSTLGPISIFNTLGQYGGTLSSMSPFSSMASSPPRIIKSERVLGYLTKNSTKRPAIDPDEFLKWLIPRRDLQ